MRISQRPVPDGLGPGEQFENGFLKRAVGGGQRRPTSMCKNVRHGHQGGHVRHSREPAAAYGS